jgi:hypothetical protein
VDGVPDGRWLMVYARERHRARQPETLGRADISSHSPSGSMSASSRLADSVLVLAVEVGIEDVGDDGPT